jgi:hypothetical protein
MTEPLNLIQRLADALKEECNWIDNPKHDELIAEALVYLERSEPGPTFTPEEEEMIAAPWSLLSPEPEPWQ